MDDDDDDDEEGEEGDEERAKEKAVGTAPSVEAAAEPSLNATAPNLPKLSLQYNC